MADSLKRRFAFRLTSSVFGAGLSIISQALVLRGLGPAAFGAFGFLTNFFTQVFGLLDSGSSTGFFSKLSQRPGDEKLKSFYGLYVIAACVLALLFVSAAQILGFSSALWPEQPLILVWIGVAWGILYWQNQVAETVVHAYGLTVQGEIMRAWQQALGLVVLFVLYRTGRLDIYTFFLSRIGLIVALQAGWFALLRRAGHLEWPETRMKWSAARDLGRELYNYTQPLLVASWVGAGAILIERWVLQKFGGSVEQGQYTLSFQIAAMFSLVTNSLSPLLTRDYSASLTGQNTDRARDIFVRTVPLMYWLAAYFGIFCSFQAEEITQILGGASYHGAAVAIRIMGIYPALQAFGNLNAILYYSSGRTKTYSRISTFISLIGLPVTFLLLAPSGMWGLHLGAEGLAIKITTITFASNQLLLWYNTKFLKIGFLKYFLLQVRIVLPLVFFAWLTSGISRVLCANHLLNFLLAGTGYSAIAVGALALRPGLMGLDRATTDSVFTALRDKFRVSLGY